MIAFLLAAVLALPVDERSIAWEIHEGRQTAAVVDSESFEAVALSWSSASSVTVRVRASNDRVTWSDWLPLAIDGDLTNESEGRYLTAITHFGEAKRYVEYSFSESVDQLTLTMFPPSARAIRERRGTNEGLGPQASGLGPAHPQSEARGPRPEAWSGITLGPLEIRSRADWGCPDGESSRWTPAYTTVTHAVVHHTAGSNTLIDWEAEVRNIWYLHTFTNGWGDIGYNFLIDPNGVIYEGRAGGAGAIGAHFSCRNTNTVGISLLGTFSNVAPSDAALTSLKRLLAQLIARNGIDPTAVLRHPSSGLNLPTILGHRDGNVPGATCTITECPGDVLYAMLPGIRTELANTAVRSRRRAVGH